MVEAIGNRTNIIHMATSESRIKYLTSIRTQHLFNNATHPDICEG